MMTATAIPTEAIEFNPPTERTHENARLSWDTCELYENEVKYRMENPNEFESMAEDVDMTDEDAVRQYLYSDPFFQDWEWECFTEALTELMKERNPDGKWEARVNNFGWRELDGHKEFQADTAEKFLQEILPRTHCTYYIWDYEEDGRKGFAIQNYHHDSPVGKEMYYVLSAKDEEKE